MERTRGKEVRVRRSLKHRGAGGQRRGSALGQPGQLQRQRAPPAWVKGRMFILGPAVGTEAEAQREGEKEKDRKENEGGGERAGQKAGDRKVARKRQREERGGRAAPGFRGGGNGERGGPWRRDQT